MRLMAIGLLIIGALVLTPGTTAAQARAPRLPRVPDAGTVAAGVDVGTFVPNSEGLSKSMLLNVYYEYYFVPRVSLRTDFGWANPAFETSGPDSLRQVPLRFDINYNYEGGKWHPFVGTGVGMYFMQFRTNNQVIGDTETKFGMNTGGGLEYFFNRRVVLKSEARYHAITNTRGIDPSGFGLTMGLKAYF